MSVPRPILSAIRAIRVVALGATATILASVIFLTSSAVAYHDTVRGGGSIGEDGGGGQGDEGIAHGQGFLRGISNGRISRSAPPPHQDESLRHFQNLFLQGTDFATVFCGMATPAAQCLLWVKSGPFAQLPIMSAFGGKADIKTHAPECPLIATSGHRDTTVRGPKLPGNQR